MFYLSIPLLPSNAVETDRFIVIHEFLFKKYQQLQNSILTINLQTNKSEM